MKNNGASEPICFLHAAAESTGVPDGSQDLVSACLLFHELPQTAAQDVVREAFRVLKPGGVLSIMVCTDCPECSALHYQAIVL